MLFASNKSEKDEVLRIAKTNETSAAFSKVNGTVLSIGHTVDQRFPLPWIVLLKEDFLSQVVPENS